MTANQFLSYLSNIDWQTAFEWYLIHMDSAHLIQAWEMGTPFSQDQWITILLMSLHLLLLLSLTALFIKRYREILFRAWVEKRRSQISSREPKEVQINLEAKVTDSACLKQAYNLHRVAMYAQALKKYEQAFESSPYEINTYLVGIKIISEMDEPYRPFVQFFQGVLTNLHEKQPAIWQEVAKYGQQKAPDLDRWQLAA